MLRSLIRRVADRLAPPDPAEQIAMARLILGPDRLDAYPHRLDSMATMHNDGFRRDPVFAAAYARAVQAAGWDYAVPWRVHQHLWCAEQARKVAGDIVELGTGRGFFMSAVLAAWPGWERSGRSLHLFDTFEPGIVEPDGSRGPSSPHYAVSYEGTQRNFAEWPRVNLYRGEVTDTLSGAPVDRIAFLHIDLNREDPEIYGLRRLWDRVPRGGVVLLDDYGCVGFDAQYDAMNALAAELGFCILTTPTGQGIILK